MTLQEQYLQLLRLLIVTLKAIGGEISIKQDSLELPDGYSVAMMPAPNGDVKLVLGNSSSQLISYKPRAAQGQTQPPVTPIPLANQLQVNQWQNVPALNQIPVQASDQLQSPSSKAGSKIVLSDERMMAKQQEQTRERVRKSLESLRHPETVAEVESNAAQRQY